MRHPHPRRRLVVAGLALAFAVGAAAAASPAVAAAGGDTGQSTQASHDQQRSTGDAAVAGVNCRVHYGLWHVVGACENPDPDVYYQIRLHCDRSSSWSPIVPTTHLLPVSCFFHDETVRFATVHYHGDPPSPPPTTPPPTTPPPPGPRPPGGPICDPPICHEVP